MQLQNGSLYRESPLRDTVIRYDEPTEPVALEDWELLQYNNEL
jgi:hypothetical protein